MRNAAKSMAPKQNGKSDKPKSHLSARKNKGRSRGVVIPYVLSKKNTTSGTEYEYYYGDIKQPLVDSKKCKVTFVTAKQVESVSDVLALLQKEVIAVKRGYRKGLYAIIVKAIVQGRRLLGDDECWAAFIADKRWGGKPPKKRDHSIRLVLKLVFGKKNGSFYWKRVEPMVESGKSDNQILTTLERERLRPTNKKPVQPPLTDISSGEKGDKAPIPTEILDDDVPFDIDDADNVRKVTKPSSARPDGGTVSKNRAGFIVPFYFPEKDAHKRFPKTDGSQLTVKGVFDAKFMQVVVASWEKN